MQSNTLARPMPRGSAVYLTLVVLVATLGGLLFGYDTAVIAGAIGFLQTHFELTPAMKGWAASNALAGCVLGVIVAGPISDRFGRRRTLILAALLFLVSALGTALPHEASALLRPLAEAIRSWGRVGNWLADNCLSPFGMFVTLRLIGGIGVGAASMTSPMYIAEISPARIRGRMVSVNQFAIVSGMLVVYFVNYFITRHGQAMDGAAAVTAAADGWNVLYGWRWMFGSEAVPAVTLLLLLLFVPESPRWLAEKGHTEKARQILTRIDGPGHARRELAEIKAALAEEPASLLSLLRPGLRVALLIGVSLAVLQQVTGINVFLYYAPEIFQEVAGSNVDVAMLQTVVVGAVNLGFTVFAIVIVDRLGRKPLMIFGAAGMGVALAAIGVAAMLDQLAGWVLVFILGYIACFAMSVGPVTWVILSEIFPTKIRGRALAVATFWLWVANGIVSQTFPMMDENLWLVAHFGHGFPFLLYAAFCVVLVGVVIALVPETKGRTLEEIERQWLVGPSDRQSGASP
ncbi:MAG: sugar porter family MFS transporter [Pirellulaceae bacterium]